jgi:LAO/AO transport system kinase
VAERTREAVLLCETAGFDVVIVETVGVGQSETQVRTMVDLLTLLIAPGGGDEVQGIKRGILEVSDLIVINKADGDLKITARETMVEYAHAIRILHDEAYLPSIHTCSARDDVGVQEIWAKMKQRFHDLRAGGRLEQLRTGQQLSWFEYRLHQEFLHTLLDHPEISGNFENQKRMIEAKEISVRSALSEMQRHLKRILR